MSVKSTGSSASERDLSEIYADLCESGADVDVFTFLEKHANAPEAERIRVLYYDQMRCQESGNPRLVQVYLDRLPDISKKFKIELIAREFQYRSGQGEQPDIEDYLGRFGYLGENLKVRLESEFELLNTMENHLRVIDSDALERAIGGEESLDGDSILTFELPERIGRYLVMDELGGGAFKRVLLGRHVELEMDAAIMVPHPNLVATETDIENFLKEGRILAGLDHPGIVKVYDAGRINDDCWRCYLTEQLVEGNDLERKLKKSRLAHRESAELIAAVAEALHYVHTKGIFHRDIKPANILINQDGKPVVVDFGLALRRDDIGKNLVQGGTVAYMSPEQARQEGHLVNGCTDIFSLGVVLYELLTGAVPFDGVLAQEVLEKIMHQEAIPPRQIDDSIPREIERICLRALEKRAADRYSTALDLAEDLRFFLEEKEKQPRKNQDDEEDEFPVPEPVAAPIIHKGLRSFDANDADFFLELVPGPRSREGLPESIRFWKILIEALDPGLTFRVSVIYGPSGSGKSSFVKAGLLPRLGKQFRRILVEATPENTENQILQQLQRRFPALDPDLTLSEACTEIRRGHLMLPGQKVLIVIDQFEQWLQGKTALLVSEMVQALRQCDGEHLQCILLIRDDFWMRLTRFMEHLEIPMVEENSAAMDLFDSEHANKVLTEFGRAHAKLPKAPAELRKDQKQFIQDAINQLAENKNVIPVRIALFAEMMKNRQWVPSTLKAEGGAQGLGVKFLEESFVSYPAPPENRLHKEAAQKVLKALLPEEGKDIKGKRQSRQALLEASEYENRPKDFDALIGILDGNLRLLTPAKPLDFQDEETANRKEKYYQLTHDYLVSPLREWLNSELNKTRPGRAKLKLEERAALWGSRQEPRQLPSLLEWLNIRLLTEPREWTQEQRDVLRESARHHMRRIGIALLIFSLFALLGYQAWGMIKARSLYSTLLLTELDMLPGYIEAEIAPHSSWTVPVLSEGLHEEEQQDIPSEDNLLRLSMALLPHDPSQVDYLADRLLRAEVDEFRLIREALAPFGDNLKDRLWTELEGGESQDSRFRAACALALYDPKAPQWESNAGYTAARLVAEDPLEVERWIKILSPVQGHLIAPLKILFSNQKGSGSNVAAALAYYLNGDKQQLVELLRGANAEQFGALAQALKDNESQSLLRQQLLRQPPLQATDEERDTFAGEQANIILGLLVEGKNEDVWTRFEGAADERIRTFLIHRPARFGLDMSLLDSRLNRGSDSFRQAIILSLGEYNHELVTVGKGDNLVTEIVRLFKDDPDPGIHSAAEWMLMKWEEHARLESTVKNLQGVRTNSEKHWYISKEGHTMVLLPDPRDYSVDSRGLEWFESKLSDKRKLYNLRKDIPRRFAISTKEVTQEQFLRFNKDWNVKGDLDKPVTHVRYLDAISYCYWLSEREGLPNCYMKIEKDGKFHIERHPDFNRRSGYRLPTYAEWEYACRAETETIRYFGVKQYAESYAWFFNNSREMPHSVGLLKPNNFGLFDTLGNVWEFCYCCDDLKCQHILLKGANFLHHYPYLSSLIVTSEIWSGYSNERYGFRIVRTLVPSD